MGKTIKNFVFLLLLLVSIKIVMSAAFITINSPIGTVASGEKIKLNVSSNETILLNYFLDNSSPFLLGNGSSFVAELNGTLPYGTLPNGNHVILLESLDSSGNLLQMQHNFTVNDNLAPSLMLNLTNNSNIAGTSNLFWILVSSNEFSSASIKLNSNSFSNFTDLGISKSKPFGIIANDGENLLSINLSDYQSNYAIRQYNFTFTKIIIPSCSDAIQNGGETGIDCGGICGPCIPFSIATDKATYNISDAVMLTVLGRPNSTINVTVRRNDEVSYRYSFYSVFPGAPVAETRHITNTSTSGNYTIAATLYYLNLSETLNSAFEVQGPAFGPLSVAINANATTINEGEAVYFTSSVVGNQSLVSYKWDFQNDGTVDSTSESVNFTFSNGTFRVNLTVTDGQQNKSDLRTITSKKLHNISVIVRNNATSALLPGAEVELDDAMINTSGEGRADFVKGEDNYNLVVKKFGFVTFSNKTSSKGASILEVNLVEQDITDPVISLIYPENGRSVGNGTVIFRYKAIDRTDSTCSIYTNKNSEGDVKQATDYSVESDVESNFTLYNIENASYQWQVECFDRYGNINRSDVFSFTYEGTSVENELSVDMEEQDQIAQDLTSEIDQILSDIDSYNGDQKMAADALDLKKQLEKAKLEVERANRDLHSLKWRRLNDTELDLETQAILKRVDDLRYSTPRSISVMEKSEFVKYPSKEDVNAALKPIINKSNLKLSRKEIRTLVDENFKHQSLITVTTKAKSIEIEYISGQRSHITLVEKNVDAKEEIDLAFYEVIPKEIEENASRIRALFDFEIIEQDPILKIDIRQFPRFAYYIQGNIDLKNIENIKSVLVEEKIKKEQDSGLTGFVTGFVPSDGFIGGLIGTIDIRLLIELAIIVVLGVVFLYYQFGGYEKLELMFNRKLSHQLKEFDFLMARISGYLDQAKYEESKVIYNEINELFKQIPKEARDKLLPRVLDVHARIDFTFMDNSLNSAFASIDAKDIAKALRLYNAISGLYKTLPKDYKSKIHVKCMELYKKIHP